MLAEEKLYVLYERGLWDKTCYSSVFGLMRVVDIHHNNWIFFIVSISEIGRQLGCHATNFQISISSIFFLICTIYISS